jgi:MFS family permease
MPYFKLPQATVHLLGLTQVIGFGTSFYLLTVLAPAISTNTGWTLASVTFGLTIGVLTGSVASPWVGRRIGQGVGRKVLMQSAICFAIGLTVIALSPNLTVYLIGWCFIGLGMSSGLYDAVFSVIGRLEGQAAKASITKIALWGGFASTVFWPLSGYLEATFGWRAACGIFAALHVLICLPIFALRLRPIPPIDPVFNSENAKVESATQPPKKIKLVVLIAALFMVEALIAACVATHLVTILEQSGFAKFQAITLASFLGPTQVAARFAQAAFGARQEPVVTVILAVFSVTIGLTVLLLAPTVAGLAIAFYGAGIGVFTIMRGTLPLTVFGSLAYPVLMGKIARPVAIVQAVAPLAGAGVLERFGTTPLLICLTALSALGFGIALALKAESR